MVFGDFDREDFIFKSFWLNILSPARSSAFFMYIIFFLEIKSSWINLGFSVENVVENEGEILNPNTFPLYNHVFDDIFDWKSKIYPWWLDFQKKKWYTWKMRKSEPDSKHFVKIRGNLRLPCQNLQKPQKKCANYLLCGFLRNWRMSRYFQNLLEFPLTFGFCLKIENLSTFFDDFFCKVV